MSASLARTRVALVDCSLHLEATDTGGSPIEAYLTQYVLVSLFSDVETALHEILVARSRPEEDPGLEAFLLACVPRVANRLAKSELAGVAAHFGDAAKTAFNSSVDERLVTAYGNALSARNRVAHPGGTSFSFRELPQAVDAAEHLLDKFESSISEGARTARTEGG